LLRVLVLLVRLLVPAKSVGRYPDEIGRCPAVLGRDPLGMQRLPPNTAPDRVRRHPQPGGGVHDTKPLSL
jgi:hypothetical protein